MTDLSGNAPPFDAIHHGDNLPFMRDLPDACCDLIYLDPPFGTGKRQTTARNGHGYADDVAGSIENHVAFLEPRLRESHRLLADTGSMFVHLDYRAAHYVKILLDRIFTPANFLNEIIWHYRTGGRSSQWFARKHDTILFYAKNKGQHTFNVIRGGEFRTDGLNRDEDGRPYKSTKNGRLYFHPDGPAITDVWDIPFLSTVSKERTGYPSQKPEALLERIILAASNDGDCVADFFCGSGTTLSVAKRLGRRFIGCDRQADAVEIARQRLASAIAQRPTT